MHEHSPGFEAMEEPNSPGEWIDRLELDLLDEIEQAPQRLAEMRDSGNRELLRAQIKYGLAQARIDNLRQLRETIGDDYSGASLHKVLDIYHQQEEERQRINASIETLQGHAKPKERIGIDNIGERQGAITMDTLGLIAFFTTYLEYK